MFVKCLRAPGVSISQPIQSYDNPVKLASDLHFADEETEALSDLRDLSQDWCSLGCMPAVARPLSVLSSTMNTAAEEGLWCGVLRPDLSLSLGSSVLTELLTTPLSIALRQPCLRHSPGGTGADTRHLHTHLLPAPSAHPLCSGPPPDVW